MLNSGENRSNTLCLTIWFHLINCGELLPIGSEGDQTGGQVYQTADLQIRVGAAGGGRADGVCRTHHVTVTPLNAVTQKPQGE